jgi:hypothetical protein
VAGGGGKHFGKLQVEKEENKDKVNCNMDLGEKLEDWRW